MKPLAFKNLKDLEKEIDAYIKITEKTYKKPKDLPPHIALNQQLEKTNLLPTSDKSSITKKKFNDHLVYKQLVNDLNYPNGNDEVKYDTWYKDIFYGRIDYKNNIIYHNYWIFQDISSNLTEKICVFDFVADAFEKMKEIYSKKKKSNKSLFLQNLEAKKGNKSTINPEKKYQQYMNDKFQEFLSSRKKELKLSSKIKNFNDFKEIFTNHLKSNDGILTFQGFFDNVNVDIYDSYLAFDILDDKNNPSDTTKIDFLNDPNYNIYEKAARQAGFFVDQNKPWRLVADLQSKAILDAIIRRFSVNSELFKTKNAVYKLLDVITEIKKEETLQRDFYEYPINIFKSQNSYYMLDVEYSTNETKELLKFIDYFRKEISIPENILKSYKSIYETYLKTSSETDPRKVKYGKSRTLIRTSDNPDPIEVSTDLLTLANAVLNFGFILYDNKELIDFIFQSLKEQISILQSVNKEIESITVKDVFNIIYCQISDYAYFTYFPRKLEEFYGKFLQQEKKINYILPENELQTTINSLGKNDFKNFNYYVIFSKDAYGKTKAIYNKREPLELTKNKLYDNVQNSFYKIDFLIDHLENRLYEEKRNLKEQEKNQILSQVKTLYEKSLEEFKNNGNYSFYRNLAITIIETYVYNLMDNKENLTNIKKVPFFAEQLLYNFPKTEPMIMIERLCLTLPERGEIIVEEECGKFAASSKAPKIKEKTPGGPGEKKGDLNFGAPCQFTEDCKAGLKCLGGFCQAPKQETGKAPIAGSGAKKGDVGIMPPDNKCTFDEDCDPKSCINLVNKCVKENPSDKEGRCQCKQK